MKIRLTFFASLIILLAIACKNSATTNTPAATAVLTTDSAATAIIMMTDATHAMMAATDSVTVYVCTMHPEVTGKKGDKCPKCKMDLVAKTDVKKADH
ncbi:MAG: heavy metal-binding domain-containing protein [Saprospiraceae bacterium]